MAERYLPPNWVPCSVCSVIYKLDEYADHKRDRRPVVCRKCRKQIDRENQQTEKAGGEK